MPEVCRTSPVRTAPRVPVRPWSDLAREHAPFVLSSAVVLVVFVWFLTFGTWGLFEADEPPVHFAERFYDAQALSLLAGRLDVPPEAIGFEAFIHDGKYYGYFGLGPALLRAPLLALFPGLEGRLHHPIMLLACATNLVAAYFLLRRVRSLFRFRGRAPGTEKVLVVLYLLLIGLGSTNLFLASRAYVYHEAIMVGATFGLLFLLAFVRYAQRRRWPALASACGCAFFTVACRASTGVGPLLVLSLFAGASLVPMGRLAAWAPRLTALLDRVGLRHTALGLRHLGHVCLAGVAVVLTVGFFLGVNYAKFGTTSGMPLHQYVAFQHFDKDGYDKIGGTSFHLANIRCGLWNYFWPGKIEFDPRFPWVYLTYTVTPFPEATLLWSDWWSNVPATMPGLLVLALAGAWAVFASPFKEPRKVLRLPLLGALAAGVPILFLVGYCERYLHDWYPFLVLAGAAGLYAILSVQRLAVPRLASAALIPLTLWGVLVHAAFTLVYQRDFSVYCGFTNHWTQPKAEEFQRWRRTIDGYFLKNPPGEKTP